MQKRYLGKFKLEVSALGLGCMGMSMGYGPSNDSESMKTLEYAIEKGASFLDTSDLYGAGHNEELIGKVLKKGLRNQVVLATKCGFTGLGKVNGSAAHIKKACDASLQRLGIDVIDLYYLHRADKNVPIEESIGAFADLVKAGKIRYVGISEVTPATIKRAYKIHPITALQTEYSLWQKKPELEILKTCRELEIGFVPYSPLGRGFLSGKYRNTNQFGDGDFRKMLPKYNEENLQYNLKIVDMITELAKKKQCTPAQLALAWLLAQGEDIVPIPGTRSIERLDENMGALDIHLSSEELQEISHVLLQNPVKGVQYPDEFNLEV